MTTRLNVTLVSMPWPYVQMPSLQLGTVHAIAERAGHSVRSVSAYLMFVEWMIQRSRTLPEAERLTIEHYKTIAECSWLTGLGDWLFTGAPFAPNDKACDDAYIEHARSRVAPDLLARVGAMRAHVGAYLEQVVETILETNPHVVGFTTTFNQNVPSLNVAARLKSARPDLPIVFGGANCDGPMGAGLHEAYRQIDYAVRGESEYAFPLTLEVIAGTRDPATVPGLVYRRNGESVVNETTRDDAVNMDDVPTPVFDEYFARLSVSPVRGSLDVMVSIPVESSRGCWWGDKHHCTFCGLNGSTIAFRSKRAERFAAELDDLARRFKRVRFQPVDNILDLRYFKTLVPWLAKTRAAGNDWTFFYEVKANLRKEQLALLRDAGVEWIQPGIESLSTRVLKLMDKGVTGLQNIRLLKWAREYGIAISWNLLYGFPGELPSDYEEIHDTLLSVSHLEAPAVARLLLERFSPYFEQPERYGIRVLGPAQHYELIYRLPVDQLMKIAYDFRYWIDDLEANPFIGRIHQRVKKLFLDPGPRSLLTMIRGADFVRIYDRRRELPHEDFTLSGVGAEIYLACDAGATLATLAERFGDRATPEGIQGLLDGLLRKRLVYREGEVYLSLATVQRPMLTMERVPVLGSEPINVPIPEGAVQS